MIPQPEGELHPTSTMTLGIIASGDGRRWGGRDKATLCHQGETLLGRLVSTWGPRCEEVIVNSHHGNAFHAHLSDRLVCDAKRDQGPCFGIAALLAACDTPLLLVAPVDLLEPPENLPVQLLTALSPSKMGAFATYRDRHSLVMLLRKAAVPAVQGYLNDGGNRVSALLEHIGAVAVPCVERLQDADAPDDLQNTRALMRR